MLLLTVILIEKRGRNKREVNCKQSNIVTVLVAEFVKAEKKCVRGCLHGEIQPSGRAGIFFGDYMMNVSPG